MIYIYTYMFVSYLAPTIEVEKFPYLASGRLMSLGMMWFKLSPLLNPRLVQFCYDVRRVSGKEHLIRPHDDEKRQSLGRLYCWWFRKFQLRWDAPRFIRTFCKSCYSRWPLIQTQLQHGSCLIFLDPSRPCHNWGYARAQNHMQELKTEVAQIKKHELK